jgi:hypothetical protein
VATDLGNDQARTSDADPRPRGGAHAATKTSRFGRKNISAPAPRAAPLPRPEAGDRVQPGVNGAGGLPGPVSWPRDVGLPRSLPVQEPPLTWSRAPITAPLPGAGATAVPATAVPATAATAGSGGFARQGAAAVRSAAASLCALAIVATVVPLAVTQIPDAIAWSLPPRLAAGGPAVVVSLVRASGLALPAMAVAGSLAALAVRWLRAGPVLLTGLLLLAAADALGDTARTVALIGADRSLHGAGAGIAMTGVVAIVAERQARRRQQHAAGEGRPTAARLVLVGWWAAFTVAGLTVAPGLMRHRVSSGDWHAALRPYPWLTGAALALAALYALLAEGTAVATARNAFPAAERAQLALLTAPVAGICAIAVAVTYRAGQAVAAAAAADAIALAGIAAITARAGSAARFAVVCAVTGFALAPAAGAVTALTAPTQSTVQSGGAVLAAALCGAALALLTRRPHARAMTAIGLLLAAASLAALGLAGLAAPSGRLLAVLCVPLAGGLAAALTASLRAAGAAGALAGLVILLAGLVAGGLAAGAVPLRALNSATTVPAAHAALATAAGHWALIAAAVTSAVALALACTGGRRKCREPDDVADGAPVPRAGAGPGHG